MTQYPDILQVVHVSINQRPSFYPLPLLCNSGILLFPKTPAMTRASVVMLDFQLHDSFSLGSFLRGLLLPLTLRQRTFGLTCTGHGEETHAESQDVAGRCHCPKKSARVKKCPLPCSPPLLGRAQAHRVRSRTTGGLEGGVSAIQLSCPRNRGSPASQEPCH